MIAGGIDGTLSASDAGANLHVKGMRLEHVGLCCFSWMRISLLRTSDSVPVA